MNFDELVKYIKGQGCRIRLFKNKENVTGGVGTFHIAEKGPLISLALKSHSKPKRAEYLLHEFGHYQQWVSGFMQILDGICDSYTMWDDWINQKVELTDFEIRTARNTMLAMEWDAELRAIALGNKLNVKHFNKKHHLSGANAYILAIKWGWLNRKDFAQSPKRKLIEPRVLSKKELFAPLSEKEKHLLNIFYKV